MTKNIINRETHKKYAHKYVRIKTIIGTFININIVYNAEKGTVRGKGK